MRLRRSLRTSNSIVCLSNNPSKIAVVLQYNTSTGHLKIGYLYTELDPRVHKQNVLGKPTVVGNILCDRTTPSLCYGAPSYKNIFLLHRVVPQPSKLIQLSTHSIAFQYILYRSRYEAPRKPPAQIHSF